MAIKTRETTATGVTNKGAPLTNAELDNNFVELTQNKVNSSELNESIDDRVNTLLQAGNGIDLSYDDAAGELTVSSEVTEITAYNGTGSTLSKGSVVYQTGVQGTNISVALASNSSASTMPAVGIVIADIANAATGQIAVAGLVKNVDTSSFTAGSVLYVGTSGALTATKPTGQSNLIQNFGRALKINASSGEILVLGAGRSNDVPNLNDGNVFIGNASNVAEKRALAAGDIASGTFADARIAQTNVTQHQSALSITESQISDLGTYLEKSGGTMTGALTLNADPTANLHAATKQYVDTLSAASLHYHDPVRVEKEGNLAATYDNGTSGVGATLTNSGTQAALVIDGVTLSTNDRVLIYEQTNAYENGIYTVTNTGSASTNWVLTRATDADSYAPSDSDSLGEGDAFYVLEGTLGAGELYVMNTSGAITFGTTAINFAQVSSAQVYTGGTGIAISGSVISSDITLDEVTTNGATTSNNISVGTVTFTNLNDGSITITGFADEDNMASNSASLIPTQQSVKAYVDANAGGGALNELDDVVISSASNGQVLKYNGTNWVNAADEGGIDLTDLSVTTNAAGTAALSYNSSTGVFSYTPPNLSSYFVNGSSTTLQSTTAIKCGVDSSSPVGFTVNDGAGNCNIVFNHFNNSVQTSGANTARISHNTDGTSASAISFQTGSGGSAPSTRVAINDGGLSVTGVITATSTITASGGNSTNWNTAYSWGDHASAGYLTSIAANSVGANELKVTGNGTTSQFLRADGDGTFTWATPTDTNTTYSAGTGLTLSSTTFSLTAAGAGAGTYGSTADGTKIDTITIDAYGRVTGVATGATGSGSGTVTSVSGGTGLTGTVTTSGSISLSQDQRVGAANTSTYCGASDTFTRWQDGATAYHRFYTNNSEEMRLTSTGTLDVDGNIVAYSTTISSDRKLKKDIETLTNALDTVHALRGVSFTWNEKAKLSGKKEVGLIAQEVQEVLPELVVEANTLNTDGETHLTVDYAKMVAVLIEAVKELSAEVELLKGN